jgi:hypothetical protein
MSHTTTSIKGLLIHAQEETEELGALLEEMVKGGTASPQEKIEFKKLVELSKRIDHAIKIAEKF